MQQEQQVLLALKVQQEQQVLLALKVQLVQVVLLGTGGHFGTPPKKP